MGCKLDLTRPSTNLQVYEWEVTNPEEHMLLVCCDGFFSKNAFVSPEVFCFLFCFFVCCDGFFSKNAFVSPEAERISVRLRFSSAVGLHTHTHTRRGELARLSRLCSSWR
jgi:hypothetical protein